MSHPRHECLAVEAERDQLREVVKDLPAQVEVLDHAVRYGVQTDAALTALRVIRGRLARRDSTEAPQEEEAMSE